MLDGAMLEPMDIFDSVDQIWPGDETGALVESEGAIWRGARGVAFFEA